MYRNFLIGIKKVWNYKEICGYVCHEMLIEFMCDRNKRIEWLDDLKGIAIIFVVIGHVAEKSFGVNGVFFNHFYTSFHMPLFMAVSGFLGGAHFVYQESSIV